MQSDNQSAIEALGIDLDRLWQHLNLEEDDKCIVVQLLLGCSRQEIAVQAVAQESEKKWGKAEMDWLRRAGDSIGR